MCLCAELLLLLKTLLFGRSLGKGLGLYDSVCVFEYFFFLSMRPALDIEGERERGTLRCCVDALGYSAWLR